MMVKEINFTYSNITIMCILTFSSVSVLLVFFSYATITSSLLFKQYRFFAIAKAWSMLCHEEMAELYCGDICSILEGLSSYLIMSSGLFTGTLPKPSGKQPPFINLVTSIY